MEKFSDKVKEINNLVVGRKTFEIMEKNNEFKKIGNPLVIVVSNKNTKNFVNSPKKAIELLRKKGFSKALIAGGSELNSSFMKENLVNEVYLDVEPIMFGKGIKLFEENNFEVKLELLNTKKLSKNTIQLHYKVLK